MQEGRSVLFLQQARSEMEWAGIWRAEALWRLQPGQKIARDQVICMLTACQGLVHRRPACALNFSWWQDPVGTSAMCPRCCCCCRCRERLPCAETDASCDLFMSGACNFVTAFRLERSFHLFDSSCGLTVHLQIHARCFLTEQTIPVL